MEERVRSSVAHTPARASEARVTSSASSSDPTSSRRSLSHPWTSPSATLSPTRTGRSWVVTQRTTSRIDRPTLAARNSRGSQQLLGALHPEVGVLHARLAGHVHQGPGRGLGPLTVPVARRGDQVAELSTTTQVGS